MREKKGWVRGGRRKLLVVTLRVKESGYLKRVADTRCLKFYPDPVGVVGGLVKHNVTYDTVHLMENDALRMCAVRPSVCIFSLVLTQ